MKISYRIFRITRSMLLMIGLLPILAGKPTFANTSVAEICDIVAADSARRIGVPVSVLKAITRTETGRKRGRDIQPWPWTVNMEGKGYWFDDEATARDFAYKEYARGARSFDIGCFQINYKWHGDAFQSIEDMFDPRKNADYAARFLLSLRAEMGSWGKAAGAYHSRTRNFAEKYQARFERIRNSLGGSEEADYAVAAELSNGNPPTEPAPEYVVARVNTYPLLRNGAPHGLGSLVPIENGGGLSLFSMNNQAVVTN
jgi:hypothetical protein